MCRFILSRAVISYIQPFNATNVVFQILTLACVQWLLHQPLYSSPVSSPNTSVCRRNSSWQLKEYLISTLDKDPLSSSTPPTTAFFLKWTSVFGAFCLQYQVNISMSTSAWPGARFTKSSYTYEPKTLRNSCQAMPANIRETFIYELICSMYINTYCLSDMGPRLLLVSALLQNQVNICMLVSVLLVWSILQHYTGCFCE